MTVNPYIASLAAIITLSPVAGGGQSLTFERIQVSDRVVAFISSDRGIGNTVAILGDESVFVVDTATPSGAENVLAEIRQLTDKPVRHVINTHWHDDHIWGNDTYREAFPGVEIVAHPSTRRDIVEQAVPALAGNIGRLREMWSARDAILASGLENGESIGADRRVALEQRQALFRGALADLETAVPALPTLTFDSALSLRSGEFEVQVLHLGRGNTGGDVVVFVPGEGVLITGDLLTHPVPAGAEAFIVEWVETMRRVRALGARVLVPGHGPVMRDYTYFDLVDELLQRVVAQARGAVDAGTSLETLQQEVDLGGLRARLTGGDEAIAQAFDRFFLMPALESAYGELSGAR